MFDVVVIGGGPAGMAAALKAREHGANKVLIIERDSELGGILNQCIHNGFGLHHFKEELTGPEYAGKYLDMVKQSDIEVMLDTMVVEISSDKVIYCTSAKYGYQEIHAKSIILTMGCRERTRGAIAIPGTRPAGVFTAGAAQRYVNIEGYMPGKRVVILGSGDIGLIMARRMTLEGAKVLGVVEVMTYSNGLNRNIVQCLHDYDIPLYLSHTITDIQGDTRVERVIVSKVDENRNPIKGSEIVFDCDCVLLSVGLIPENELSRKANIEINPKTNGPIVDENMQTSIPGIFACGNVLHVHDLVDFVSDESEKAGVAAANYVCGVEEEKIDTIHVLPSDNVNYVVPCFVKSKKDIEFSFRVKSPLENVKIILKSNGNVVASFKREHMVPSEMEKVKLPKVLLDKVDGKLSIGVEVQE